MSAHTAGNCYSQLASWAAPYHQPFCGWVVGPSGSDVLFLFMVTILKVTVHGNTNPSSNQNPKPSGSDVFVHFIDDNCPHGNCDRFALTLPREHGHEKNKSCSCSNVHGWGDSETAWYRNRA